MINDKKVLSIIPARGDSKRILRKNLVSLGGKPLIYHTINHSLQSNIIDRTIVSTEDSEIKEISLKLGAEVVDRPKELAKDGSSTLDVLKDVIHQLELKENYSPDIVVVLQPTSPIRDEGRVDQALKLFVEKDTDMVVSLEKRHLEPRWILENKEGKLKFILENKFDKIRSQEQEDTYELNGSITIYLKKLILEAKNYVFGENVQPFVMSKRESFQIDTAEDLEIIKKLMENENS